jgi:hypothetical protein
MKFFETPWMFFSFESDSGCSLEVTYLAQDDQLAKGKTALSGLQALANFKAKMNIPYEELDEDIIPKDDPYYLEMMKRSKQYRQRMTQSLSQTQATLFNHPLLKFYHERKATQKKEALDEELHKLKLFQLIKWDRIRLMKRQIEEQVYKNHLMK